VGSLHFGNPPLVVLSFSAGVLFLLEGAYSSLTASNFGGRLDLIDLILLYVLGIGVIAASVLLLRNPSYSIALGAAILVLSVVSIIKGGGFLVGLVLGIAGGAPIVLWKPTAHSPDEGERVRKLILLITVLIGCAAVLPVEIAYQSAMHAARQRISEGYNLFNTSSGPLQYATTGEGYPVLLLHGAGGGFDQGLIMAEVLLGTGFRVIAPSRFGFLNTPIPADPSPAAQADALVELLDDLQVPQAAIMGISAGGPTALQFALRHSDRTSVLLMVSAVSHPIPPGPQDIVLNLMLRSDFAWWLITANAQSQLVSFLGVSKEVQTTLTAAEREWLYNTLIPSFYPITLRQPGMANDGKMFAYSMRNWPLGQITVPTLVVHARDDGLVPFSHGENSAREIPEARLIALDSGGHLLVGQHERVRSEIHEFVAPYLR
jgi:2-hydroxy-6-oxonona-2,4-dienedioate hydrolase